MEKKSSRAIAYYRLSKEDSAKSVSDSIENQKKLIREYVLRTDGIELVDEVYDDGYTGTNYDRPGFGKVMEAVEAGSVDCLIVKDLSRLGREYIETGRYLEKVFPALGVRVIAVNDDYDSASPRQSDDLIVPVKNLMNETYCRDLSNKLRRQFAVQRKNGEYVGAYVSYGYLKAPGDRHKLIVDEYAAGIVREIFSLKINGYSQASIAERLNAEGVLAPSEYKKTLGIKYKSGFSSAKRAEWGALTITRILKNTIYVGELIQGKRGTPNFKVKKVRERRPDEWVKVEHNHEPIVDRLTFEAVRKLLAVDTRRPPGETLFPLAGIVYCADCGSSMVRRSVTTRGKKYLYYVCSAAKRGNGCKSHGISVELLENAVLDSLRIQINTVVELAGLLSSMNADELHAAKRRNIQIKIDEKEKELESCREFKSQLLESLNDGLIDRDEFTTMRDKYRKLESECTAAIESLSDSMSKLDSPDGERAFIGQYLKFSGLETLSRGVVATLIDRVTVYADKRIEITYSCKDEIAYYSGLAAESLKGVG